MATFRRFALDASLTNGRYELPRSARGVLVLADPPEAGWRIRTTPECKAADREETPASCGAEDRERG
jgi:hypothetical protein